MIWITDESDQFNPLIPKSDEVLISLYNLFLESNV